MEEPIEMDEIGRGNEGYDDDNNGDYDDFNPSTEETELITNDDNVGDDDINKSFTKDQVDDLSKVNYKSIDSLTKSTIELLDLELKDFLKHMGYDDNDTTYIEKERFKLVKEKGIKKLLYERENDDWVPLTKNNGKFYNKQTIRSKFGGVGNMDNILGNTKLSPREAGILNDLPSTSELKNANDIELQSMTEKTIKSVHTIDTSFIDNDYDYGATKQLSKREILAIDREMRRIGGALKVSVAKKIEVERHIERENNKLKDIEGKSYEEEEAEEIKDIKDAIIKKKNELNDELKERKERNSHIKK